MIRFTFILLLAAPLAAFAAPEIGYAQATGYYKKDSQPTLYQPLNLLDGREATSWCSTTSDALGDTLTFGFKGPVTIDQIKIATGNGGNDKIFQQFSRAKKIQIKTGRTAQTVILEDRRGVQSTELSAPLSGVQFTMEVLDQYLADDLEAPVCIADVIFYSQGKPLNGSWLAPKLKYDSARSALLGTWFAGPGGAADKFLSFFLDGTYWFAHGYSASEANDNSFGGTYRSSGSEVAMELPRKGRVSAQIRRSRKTNSVGQSTQSLLFEGDLPKDLRQPFRDHL
jgi:hypothetical protein